MLGQKVTLLEQKIADLETVIQSFKPVIEDAEKNQEQGHSPSVQIDHLHVDKIIIEHLDYANNFGQLGVKDLSGQLNIGTTYHTGDSDEISEMVNQKVAEKLGSNLKVNLKSKKDS